MPEANENHVEEFDQIKQHDEELLSVFRKSIIPFRFAFMSPFIILFVMTISGTYITNMKFIIYDVSIGGILMVLLFYRAFFLWSKSMVLLTNMRVISLAQRSFFKREKFEAYLADVCEVGEKVEGFNQAVFKFGNILVQTEAELWLENVEHPHEVSEAIFQAIHSHKHGGAKSLPNRFWKNKK